MARSRVIIHAVCAILCGFRWHAATDAMPTDARVVMAASSRGMSLEDQPISKGDREIVKYWLKATDVDEATKCSVDYIRELRVKFESDQKVTTMSHTAEVCEQIMNDILSSCGKDVMNKVVELVPTLRDYIDYIFGNKFNDFAQRTTHEYRPMRILAEWMFRMVGVEDRNNRQGFIEAWRNGPCRPIISRLSQSEFRQVANYLDMINESRFDPMRLRLNVFRVYIPIIQGCRYFDNVQSLNEIWSSLQIRDTEIEERVRHNAGSGSSGK